MIKIRLTGLIVLICVLALGGSAYANTIVSAPGGGYWTDDRSWIDGVAPGVGDFQSKLCLSGNGSLHVEAPFVIDGSLELWEGELRLGLGSSLSHLGGWLRGGSLYCNGNDVILHGRTSGIRARWTLRSSKTMCGCDGTLVSPAD